MMVNLKPARIALFRRLLPAGTPILSWECAGWCGDVVHSQARSGFSGS